MFARSDATTAEYDEREMFSHVFPLVAAWPTPEAIAAVMPPKHVLANPDVARRELLRPPIGHAVRRSTTAPWSSTNVEVVRIPDEILALHAEEVADVLSQAPVSALNTPIERFAPHDEYRDAQLSLLRQRMEVDPVTWATSVAKANEHGMIVVAEHARDWAPWIPMLRFALSLRDLDETHLVLRAAEHRLRLIARRMLDADGFREVRVDDVLNAAPQLQHALSTLLAE